MRRLFGDKNIAPKIKGLKVYLVVSICVFLFNEFISKNNNFEYVGVQAFVLIMHVFLSAFFQRNIGFLGKIFVFALLVVANRSVMYFLLLILYMIYSKENFAP